MVLNRNVAYLMKNSSKYFHYFKCRNCDYSLGLATLYLKCDLNTYLFLDNFFPAIFSSAVG